MHSKIYYINCNLHWKLQMEYFITSHNDQIRKHPASASGLNQRDEGYYNKLTNKKISFLFPSNSASVMWSLSHAIKPKFLGNLTLFFR